MGSAPVRYYLTGTRLWFTNRTALRPDSSAERQCSLAWAHLWATAVTQPLGWNSFTSSSQNRQREFVCSHPCRFAPKEMKTQDISFTPLFSANYFHTQNWIKHFSVKHEYANISMQDQDIHSQCVKRWVEIFYGSFLAVFQMHKNKQLIQWAGDNIRQSSFVLSVVLFFVCLFVVVLKLFRELWESKSVVVWI